MVRQQVHQPAKTSVSSRSSPLGTFRAKSVDKRMFSQVTSTSTTQNLKPAETASKWLEKRTECGTDNTNKRLVIFIFEYFQKAESEFRTQFVYSHDFFKKYKFQRTFTEPSSMPKLQPIFHFLQVNPLVQGLKLLEGPPSLPHMPNCTYETRGFFFAQS